MKEARLDGLIVADAQREGHSAACGAVERRSNQRLQRNRWNVLSDHSLRLGRRVEHHGSCVLGAMRSAASGHQRVWRRHVRAMGSPDAHRAAQLNAAGLWERLEA